MALAEAQKELLTVGFWNWIMGVLLNLQTNFNPKFAHKEASFLYSLKNRFLLNPQKGSVDVRKLLNDLNCWKKR